jgi:hypothetical protein
MHLVHFFRFWYHVPRKIWQPCSSKQEESIKQISDPLQRCSTFFQFKCYANMTSLMWMHAKFRSLKTKQRWEREPIRQNISGVVTNRNTCNKCSSRFTMSKSKSCLNVTLFVPFVFFLLNEVVVLVNGWIELGPRMTPMKTKKLEISMGWQFFICYSI